MAESVWLTPDWVSPSSAAALVSEAFSTIFTKTSYLPPFVIVCVLFNTFVDNLVGINIVKNAGKNPYDYVISKNYFFSSNTFLCYEFAAFW